MGRPRGPFGQPMSEAQYERYKKEQALRAAAHKDLYRSLAAKNKKKEAEEKAKRASQPRPAKMPNGRPYPPGYWDKVYGTTPKKTSKPAKTVSRKKRSSRSSRGRSSGRSSTRYGY